MGWGGVVTIASWHYGVSSKTGSSLTSSMFVCYLSDFEAVNSVAQREEGFLKKVEGSENPVVTKKGYYAFRSPEGLYFHVDYVADENGFRASNDPLLESPKIYPTEGF
uniref:Uncharacterized protein n=1 Tax=Timema shepardi TaxID=629360 RepID=A0A7R9G6R2_TIMSH|nr:unnamed protein product [Timema shepardi]